MCQISKIENNSNIFLICATNCPWDIDSAILRRFQKRLYISLPNPSERYELFKLFTKDTSLEGTTMNWIELVQRTEGYSGSDLYHIIQHALTIPLFELHDTKIWKICADGFYEPANTSNLDTEDIVCDDLSALPSCTVRARLVEPLDLVNALDTVRITVSKEELKKYCIFERD